MSRAMIKKTKLKTVVGVCLFALIASNGNSQPREQAFSGARPLGMGETFVAIADDGNTVYWNPAGLPTLKRYEFNSMYGSLYGDIGLNNGFLSFALPLSQRFGLGATWLHTGFGDDELEFFRNISNLAIGAKVDNNIFIGASLKYLSTDTKDFGHSLGKANAIGFDFGALLALPMKNTGLLRQINFGLMAYDAGGTRIRFNRSAGSETILPQNIRFGLALLPQETLLLKRLTLKDARLALDFDDRIHVGAETWMFDNLAIRAGAQKDRHKTQDEGLSYSFGGSLRFKSLQLDYAYVIPPVLPAAHFFSFAFNLSPSPVKITDLKLVSETLFASLYNSYATTPIGYVTIQNDHGKKLPVTMSVSIPGLTATETRESFFLLPNQPNKIYFSVVLPKDILQKRLQEYHQVKIRLDYKINGENKYVDDAKKFALLGRGAITWEDPGKAAAFITKRERLVKLFADEVTDDLPYRPEIALGKIYKAACLFDAMGAAGINYDDRSENLYSNIPKNQNSIDLIQYPVELLMSRKGDCDDLTVLYASLLECSGVKTALLSTEKHITLMFDTGIHEQNWGGVAFGRLFRQPAHRSQE